MFAYVSCHPDIAYTVTTLSKFSTCLTKLQYTYMKDVIKYVQSTKHWVIIFHCNCSSTNFHQDLPAVILQICHLLYQNPYINSSELSTHTQQYSKIMIHYGFTITLT